MAENGGIDRAAHAFDPWQVLGGTRVVAAESQWRLPLKWDREAKAAGRRDRVFCGSRADVFEDWPGPMTGARGERLWAEEVGPEEDWAGASVMLPGGGWHTLAGVTARPVTPVPLTMRHVRSNLFALIERTPHLDWLLPTKRPENVRRMWDECQTPPLNPLPANVRLTFHPPRSGR